MKLIDEELGGTTPLEIIIKFPRTKLKQVRMMNLRIGVMKMTIKMRKKYWFKR